MTAKIREFSNYGGLVLKAIDRETLDDVIFGAIPMRLFKTGENILLTVEVWDDLGEFEAGQPSHSKFNRTFELTFGELQTLYPASVQPLCAEFYDWLEIDGARYDLESFDINLTSLKIKVKAVHKTTGQTCKRETRNLSEFEQIKADHSALVAAYFALCWTHIKTNDPKLARFYAD